MTAVVKSYSDIRVDVLERSQYPASLVFINLQTCMKKDINPDQEIKNFPELVRYILTAEHGSPLEIAKISVRASGISRSLLAQITRKRTFSFMSSSQHYQNYNDYGFIIHPELTIEQASNPELSAKIYQHFEDCISLYNDILEAGFPNEEARQVLPGASEVNLNITADARNLAMFFRERRCLRNVEEMVTFADKLYKHAVNWFPELFSQVGPPCFMDGKCNQGRMMAEVCKSAGRTRI